MIILTLGYDAGLERKFNEALAYGDLVAAREILERMPPAHTLSDEAKRVVTLAQGYKALTNAYEKNVIRDENQGTGLQEKLDQANQELEKYKKIGKFEEIEAELKKVGDYEEKLASYEKLGSPEMIVDKLDALIEEARQSEGLTDILRNPKI